LLQGDPIKGIESLVSYIEGLLSLNKASLLQDILKHVSKREYEELMCADQLTRERHKRKAFFNFSKNSGCSSTPMDKLGYTAVTQKNVGQKNKTKTNINRYVISCSFC